PTGVPGAPGGQESSWNRTQSRTLVECHLPGAEYTGWGIMACSPSKRTLTARFRCRLNPMKSIPAADSLDLIGPPEGWEGRVRGPPNPDNRNSWSNRSSPSASAADENESLGPGSGPTSPISGGGRADHGGLR